MCSRAPAKRAGLVARDVRTCRVIAASTGRARALAVTTRFPVEHAGRALAACTGPGQLKVVLDVAAQPPAQRADPAAE